MDELKQLKQADYTFGVTKHEDVRKVLNENASATNGNNAAIVAELDKKADAAAVTAELDKKADAATVTAELGGKVDKVPGKGLSTNDYTNDAMDAVDSLPFVGEFDDLAALRSAISLGVTRSAFLCKVGGITLLVRYTGATGNTGTGTYYFMSAPKVVTYLTWVGQTGKPTTYTQWATADLGGSGLPDGVHFGPDVEIGTGVNIQGASSGGVDIYGPLSIGTIGIETPTVRIGIGTNTPDSELIEADTIIYRGVKIGATTRIGDNVLIAGNTRIWGNAYIGTGVNIGSSVSIGTRTDIRGGVIINSDAFIGSQVYISGDNLTFDNILGKLVTIGSNVIIGTGRYITPSQLEMLEVGGLQKTIIAENVHIGMDETPLDNTDGVHIRGRVSIGSDVHISDGTKIMNLAGISSDELNYTPGSLIGTGVIIGTGEYDKIANGHYSEKSVVLGDRLYIDGGLTIYADAQGLHVKGSNYNKTATIPWD